MALVKFAKGVGAWALIGIAFTDCVATIIKVEGSSMQPTFNVDPSRSDWVLVEKITCKWMHKYERGSIVVLWAPDEPYQQLIKRLVGLPGDAVWEDTKDTPTKIPEGRCWIEGDNTSGSGDSRNLYGPVHLGLIEGRVTHVVWPPAHWRRISNYVPAGKLLDMDADPCW